MTIAKSKLTFDSGFTLLFASAGKNEPKWLHAGEMLCSLISNAVVSTSDEDGLPVQISFMRWSERSPLLGHKTKESELHIDSSKVSWIQPDRE